jgi:hypothetical protein
LPLIDPEHANEYSVGLLDALAQVARCQHPWHALASIDSALHAGLLTQAELREAFSRLPLRCRGLVELADGRAEAGQETVLRMIARSAGLQFELQVQIAELGRVDLLIEGCLVVEADSRLAHDGWDLHVRDRWRDLIAARHGYMSLRPAYQHTMWTPNLVRDAIVHLLDANRHFRRYV